MKEICKKCINRSVDDNGSEFCPKEIICEKQDFMTKFESAKNFKSQIRRFYGFKVKEGIRERIYISSKPKVKCFTEELPEFIFLGFVTQAKCTRGNLESPKEGNIYSTIKGVHFVCTKFWLTECNE